MAVGDDYQFINVDNISRPSRHEGIMNDVWFELLNRECDEGMKDFKGAACIIYLLAKLECNIHSYVFISV